MYKLRASRPGQIGHSKAKQRLRYDKESHAGSHADTQCMSWDASHELGRRRHYLRSRGLSAVNRKHDAKTYMQHSVA